ncbi:hypothetical protein EVAR_50985_1 [Eumeta japonica]|uniref:Uncharacterized protein n=1 Tax=Eumeta variegata TaxID=151549 RepID=A0A4C1X9Y5_EUMVA|nr:hypothetical protein EVAR_50985_1 [Eumeta japonica]
MPKPSPRIGPTLAVMLVKTNRANAMIEAPRSATTGNINVSLSQTNVETIAARSAWTLRSQRRRNPDEPHELTYSPGLFQRVHYKYCRVSAYAQR